MPVTHQSTVSELPTISLTALSSPDKPTHQLEVSRLLRICETRGFFYLCDHGIPIFLIDRAIKASRAFFHLPKHTKEKFGHHAHNVQPPSCRGYSAAEKLNEDTGFDAKQLYDLGIERENVPGKRFTGPNLLPSEEVAPDFAASLLELQENVMNEIAPTLYRALGEALGVGSGFFEQFLKEPTLIQRVIYYPARKGTAGKHTDNGLITILIQERSVDRSLKVYTEGMWTGAEARDDLLVVNLGDILQFWTGAQFISTPHQVVHEGEKDRISLPFFIYPDIDATFEPFGEPGKKVRVIDVMDRNFQNIWVTGKGAGRARELK